MEQELLGLGQDRGWGLPLLDLCAAPHPWHSPTQPHPSLHSGPWALVSLTHSASGRESG